MIYIDRNRDNEEGSKISPDETWFAKALDATESVIANHGDHEFDRDIYGADIVRAALEELFHNKCAYCYGPLPETWDVEHFRPKGRIAKNNDHPGYYWLAYTWANLLPSCVHCNRRRKDKPVWGDLRYGTTGGKYDQFPLVDENKRAMSPGDCLASEDHLLLDPCNDNPEKHIVYLVNGDIAGIDDYGNATIHICHLKRRRLRKKREEIIRDIIDFIELIRDTKRSKKPSKAKKIETYFREKYLSDKCSFAAVSRCVANRPELFGI